MNQAASNGGGSLALTHSMSSQQVSGGSSAAAAAAATAVGAASGGGVVAAGTATNGEHHSRQTSEPFRSFQQKPGSAAAAATEPKKQPLNPTWVIQQKAQPRQPQKPAHQQPATQQRRLFGSQKPQFIRPDRLAHLYHAFMPNHRPRLGQQQAAPATGTRDPLQQLAGVSGRHHHPSHHHQQQQLYETAGSIMSSDLDTTSFFDSEDEAESSRFSTTTATTMSSNYFHRFRQRQRKAPRISRASSFSSITESSLSLNVITVTLDMDSMQFLGISIVGQASRRGADGGIYVGSIMKGGAVHQDGRIQPGDLILEVNGIPFDRMENDDAVRILREQVQRAGPISLTVAKSWNCRQYLRVSQEEPVRPIDPRAWILHTNAVREAEAALMVNPEAELAPSRDIGSADTVSDLDGIGTNAGDAIDDAVTGQLASIDEASIGFEQQLHQHRQQSSQLQNQHHSLQQQQQLMTTTALAARSRSESSSSTSSGSAKVAAAAAAVAVRMQQQCPVERPRNLALQHQMQQQQQMPTNSAHHHGTTARSLTVHSECCDIVRVLRLPESGLEVRDRVWLKIRIPCAFIGSELVDWLLAHVDGFRDRREAKKLACQLLRSGLIRHTVNKASFSEQCYYVFAAEPPPPPPPPSQLSQAPPLPLSRQPRDQHHQQHIQHHHHFQQLEEPSRLMVKLPPLQSSSSTSSATATAAAMRSFSLEQLDSASEVAAGAFAAAPPQPPSLPPPQPLSLSAQFQLAASAQHHRHNHHADLQTAGGGGSSLPRKPLPPHHLSNTATAGGTVLSVGSGSSSSQKSSIIASYSSVATQGNYNNLRLAHCS